MAAKIAEYRDRSEGSMRVSVSYGPVAFDHHSVRDVLCLSIVVWARDAYNGLEASSERDH